MAMEITETLEDGCFGRGTYCGNYSEMSWQSPDSVGLPFIILVECGEEQPRENHPRIKFCADRNMKSPADNYEINYIPFMICDEPYIPDSHKHIKHNLTEEDLDKLKTWVVKNKELLLKTGESEFGIYTFYKQCWKG